MHRHITTGCRPSSVPAAAAAGGAATAERSDAAAPAKDERQWGDLRAAAQAALEGAQALHIFQTCCMQKSLFLWSSMQTVRFVATKSAS